MTTISLRSLSVAGRRRLSCGSRDYLRFACEVSNDPLWMEQWGLKNTGGVLRVVDADIDADEAGHLLVAAGSGGGGAGRWGQGESSRFEGKHPSKFG